MHCKYWNIIRPTATAPATTDMSLPKKIISVDPEVNKFPGVRRDEGETYRAQVYGYVRLQTNHAVLILFLLCAVLSLVTASIYWNNWSLYWKVRELDLKNQILEKTVHDIICGLGKEMELDENLAHMCPEQVSPVRAPDMDETAYERESYSMNYAEHPRVKRDKGAKFDAIVNATMSMKSPEQGGRYYDGLRSGRGVRGKILRTGKKLKTLKKRLAVVERTLLNVKISIFRRLESSEPRAAFLYMNKDELRLTKKNGRVRLCLVELIGPWRLDSNGTGIGFADQWLKTISMNPDKSTVTILENGMYFIYAQVFYHFDPSKTTFEDGNHLGYRITLRKNPERLTNPIHLAECVTPPLPTKSYLTCFTQVAWYLDQLDELYLENIHFTPNARSTIFSENPAQTFFGIVKL